MYAFPIDFEKSPYRRLNSSSLTETFSASLPSDLPPLRSVWKLKTRLPSCFVSSAYVRCIALAPVAAVLEGVLDEDRPVAACAGQLLDGEPHAVFRDLGVVLVRRCLRELVDPNAGHPNRRQILDFLEVLDRVDRAHRFFLAAAHLLHQLEGLVGLLQDRLDPAQSLVRRHAEDHLHRDRSQRLQSVLVLVGRDRAGVLEEVLDVLYFGHQPVTISDLVLMAVD